MNQAWVGGGLPLPNSAVPVLPNESDGSPAPAAVPPDCTTLAMNERKVTTTFGSSGGAAGDFTAGFVVRTGACHCPAATAAATDAIWTGLASRRPCPIADAASSARSLGFGNVPPYDGTPSDQWTPKPNDAAAFSSALAGNWSASPMNALLHEIWKAWARSRAPDASPSKLLNGRPSTVMVAGHGAGVDPVLPAASSAAEVITLNVEPGGYAPSSARSKPLSGFETTARI